MSANSRGSVWLGAFWMFLISLLLFWAPGVGGLLAGIVGGKVAGGVGPALLAALLPAFVLGGLLFFFATALTGLLAIGVLAGLGGFALGLVHIGMLLLGAIIGGLLA
ncbi:MAG: hypothetical protein QJR02_12490 [Sinobacteraceae bacterium]|nr:hypothetical protein [Nevskiaceae bacterium]